MVDHPVRFAWYELMTTDVAAARAFYADVVGWGTEDVSTPGHAYVQFSAGATAVAGLLELPEEAQKKGATPRWEGYLGSADVAATAAQFKRLGGTVFVPPTDANIGRIAVVADPEGASLALVEGLKVGAPRPAGLAEPGHVGWHELYATDHDTALAFYGEIFGWRRARDETAPPDAASPYRLFAAGPQTLGGILHKPAWSPVPFWLYYFNVANIDAALQRVVSGGGQVFVGPDELPGGTLFARCSDPQGGGFALQGPRTKDSFVWSTNWGEFSSRGRLVTKPR